MRFKYKITSLHPKKWFFREKEEMFGEKEHDTTEPVSRMERKQQRKESKLDSYMYRASLYSFAIICIMLAFMPFVYFLPWEQIAEWLVFLLLGALFISFTLSALTVKKQSKYVKLPHMWGIMLFSIFLLGFYLSVLIYFRFFLVA
ncbi:DUF2157 domain-containing protein [Alteribacillus iranensis]|uniref:Predicted membrane protein n=1 Tax=Alteribacillus iranensis TaxID=930128 RepID=A0A1I2FAN8_9BACI|nr:DUF2157 domain-containing protein [Alteribacillus iranensis]SFF02442.1 Predicted membrane protein [Alteribacillus iranensis]